MPQRLLVLIASISIAGCSGEIDFGEDLTEGADAGRSDRGFTIPEEDAGDNEPRPDAMPGVDTGGGGGCATAGQFPATPLWTQNKANYKRILYDYAKTATPLACNNAGCHGGPSRPLMPANEADLDDAATLMRAISEFYTAVRPGNDTAPIIVDHGAGGVGGDTFLDDANARMIQMRAGCP